jgi:hypothetical protein
LVSTAYAILAMSAVSTGARVVSPRGSLSRPSAEDVPSGPYEIRLDDHRFTVEATGEGLTARRGGDPAPNAILQTDAATLTDLLLGHTTLTDAQVADTVRLSGRPDALQQLLRACS